MMPLPVNSKFLNGARPKVAAALLLALPCALCVKLALGSPAPNASALVGAKDADACEANATTGRGSSILSLALDGGAGEDMLTLLLEDSRVVTLDSGAVVRVTGLSIGSRVSLEGGQFGTVTALRGAVLPSSTEQPSGATTSSPVRFARVVATVSRQTRALVNLRTAAGLTQTTQDHPFAKKGSGWTPASELRVGDEIVTAAAEAPVKVLAVENQAVAPLRVYNFSVEPSHAYFVGTEAMLVHNAPGCAPRPSTAPPPRRGVPITFGRFEVTDNTGVKKVRGIKMLDGSDPKYASVGDIVLVTVTEAARGGRFQKGDIVRAVVVRTTTLIRRADGSWISFPDNAVVLIDPAGRPIGTRIDGPVAREVHERNGRGRVVSLAPEVL
jgi:large subunit ribosomal protein L14